MGLHAKAPECKKSAQISSFICRWCFGGDWFKWSQTGVERCWKSETILQNVWNNLIRLTMFYVKIIIKVHEKLNKRTQITLQFIVILLSIYY